MKGQILAHVHKRTFFPMLVPNVSECLEKQRQIEKTLKLAIEFSSQNKFFERGNNNKLQRKYSKDRKIKIIGSPYYLKCC